MPQSYYLLQYDLAPDYGTRRADYREPHLRLAWETADRDEMILGGPVLGDVASGLMLFQGDSPSVAENFARNDPYVVNGLVTQWRITEWKTTVGKNSLSPDRL